MTTTTTDVEAQVAAAPLADWDPAGRTARVVAAAGGVRRSAGLLAVAPATVTRWAKGDRRPSGREASFLVDVDYVITRISLLYPGEGVAVDWLTTPNRFLDDRRPIDALHDDGPGEVIAALDSEAAGSYP